MSQWVPLLHSSWYCSCCVCFGSLFHCSEQFYTHSSSPLFVCRIFYLVHLVRRYSTRRVAVLGGFICTFFRVVQFTVIFVCSNWDRRRLYNYTYTNKQDTSTSSSRLSNRLFGWREFIITFSYYLFIYIYILFLLNRTAQAGINRTLLTVPAINLRSCSIIVNQATAWITIIFCIIVGTHTYDTGTAIVRI